MDLAFELPVSNLALLAKTGWQLQQDMNTFWTKVICHKYLQTHTILEAHQHRFPRASFMWHAIQAGAYILVVWRIGNGQMICFWIDNWALKGALVQYSL